MGFYQIVILVAVVHVHMCVTWFTIEQQLSLTRVREARCLYEENGLTFTASNGLFYRDEQACPFQFVLRCKDVTSFLPDGEYEWEGSMSMSIPVSGYAQGVILRPYYGTPLDGKACIIEMWGTDYLSDAHNLDPTRDTWWYHLQNRIGGRCMALEKRLYDKRGFYCIPRMFKDLTVQ